MATTGPLATTTAPLASTGNSGTTIAARKWTRKIAHGKQFTATAALDHLAGNERPHFSLTAATTKIVFGTERYLMGGARHTEIVRVFPQLQPLAEIHLADDHGVPMYAVDNGYFWLVQAADAPRFDHVASLWRVPEDTVRGAWENVITAPDQDGDAPDAALIRSRARTYVGNTSHANLARWQREADAALALIRDGA